METQHLHEIVRPIRDIVRGVGEFVVGALANKIVPREVFDHLINGVESENTGGAPMLDRELYDQQDFRFDDQGRYFEL